MTVDQPGRPRSRQEALIQRVSSTRTFARIAPRLLPRIDRTVHRLSGGRVMISQYLLPSIFLTTTGRRSGAPRVTPLACLPEPDGGLLVIGSNFGQAAHPAWTGNLLAAPEALVERRGRTTAVTARLLEGPERAAAWAALLRMWPPYAAYQARVERELRIFRLEPVPVGAAGPGRTGPKE
ncbi:nitroreductase family deazaflavin-dependent oxidoreductase [Streptacidiphilus sp. P02-A3a]|uniref:nitroreductase family deazaflavin-dependent oxidoreductase n=1 Tax=Streptacidiphilus sp. P02-A3a TaxID=2704468 RepID=UPI0015FDB5F5|nr:nitroreductase family deazaflavin-dependent oxidoreductase [Streptacidiphilus sp. P02-A3a]QMU72897.1 nitroreductase family deazaflavin-dependent oxidoreductase [Streptacidiphilus sp. P02-A3a]